jgi:L-aspartate oxidase
VIAPFESEFIVVGSGIAGLRAAIELAQTGRVLILTKAEISESNSAYAQGGIAAAIGPGDSVENHYEDTIAAGAGLCEPEAVRLLVAEGPAEIERLVEWGTDFDKSGQQLSLGREGGHSAPRIVHGNGGLTGRAVIEALLSRARTSPNIQILSFTSLRELLATEDRLRGIKFQHRDQLVECYGRSVLLATGGGSQVYRETTNPGTATGDGIATAYRAGALLRDMEFVQFHPTALNLPGAPRFLLTEALRGEGARLVDDQGQRFVDELRTRDEVSRAIFQRRHEHPGREIFLDVTHLPAETIKKKFLHVYTMCLQHGLDITAQRIPVTPAAHYFMGGIYTDLNGRTTLRSLYAAGEVASTGVHGANRLASNSLLEALVFGGRTAKAMREDALASSTERAHVSPAPLHNVPTNEIHDRIRETTWLHAGVVRNGRDLARGIETLREIDQEISEDDPAGHNLSVVAKIIHEAALARTESRGAHYREDFPALSAPPVHSYTKRAEPVTLR